MLKKWGWLILIVIAMAALAATASFWLKPLLEFIKVESSRIQALADGIQIVLWIITAIALLAAEIRRRKKSADHLNPATAPAKTSIETAGNVQDSVQIIGDKNKVVQAGTYIKKQVVKKPDGASGAALRTAYLNRIFSTCRGLSLTGIDPKSASEAESRLHLEAVYTALLTKQSEMHEHRQIHEMPEKESRQLSAVEQLNRHKRLVLLGDPGSGKSTFVNFVTLCLAGHTLANNEANISRLTAPLPDMKKDNEKPKPQPWSHGALLPMRIILRDFAARGLPAGSEKAGADHLWCFIEAELQRAGIGDYAPHLRKELLNKGGLLLLDGLDEVPEANRRRQQLKEAVEDFFATFQNCRALVTSRTYAYQKQDWRLPDFAEALLAPFSNAQIELFIENWYRHIAVLRGMNSDDAQGRAELLKRAIFGNDRLQGLAERPLLLTLMASLHAWRGGSLPEKREELYADTVSLLLDWWESPKVVRNSKGEIEVQQPSLAEWLRIDREKVRSLLNKLAFAAHEKQPELTGTADIAEGDLVSGMMHLSRNPQVNPARLVEYLSQRAGLLLPRGVQVYTFPHRTFQEYLAACYLTDHEYPDKLAELARNDPNRWREVALLAAAKSSRGADFAVWALAECLCHQQPKAENSAEDTWGAHLAGQVLAESANLTQISGRNQNKLALVRDWLINILGQSDFPATERAAAGTTLARLGDPRFLEEAWYLPDEPLLGFVEIPKGAFRMGSDKKHDKEAMDHEFPQHELTLPTFYLARYPVTVAQFRAFVDDSGHEPETPGSLTGVANHPVRYVTWHEALKYGAWLTEKLRQWQGTPAVLRRLLSEEKWVVTLPSEAEWEKAARGADGRLYPWGDEPDPNKANYGDTGIGTTSTVGCFPNGKSPYGCEEMSGNVWEWTRSLWGKEWSKPDFGFPYDPADDRENLKAPNDILRVLRGGAFGNNLRDVRCAGRHRIFPNLRDYNIGFRLALRPLL